MHICSGPIPTTLGQLSNLLELCLQNNELSGEYVLSLQVNTGYGEDNHGNYVFVALYPLRRVCTLLYACLFDRPDSVDFGRTN